MYGREKSFWHITRAEEILATLRRPWTRQRRITSIPALQHWLLFCLASEIHGLESLISHTMGVSTLINLVEGRTRVELEGDYFIYYGLTFFNLDYQFLPLLQLGPARKTYHYSLHLVLFPKTFHLWTCSSFCVVLFYLWWKTGKDFGNHELVLVGILVWGVSDYRPEYMRLTWLRLRICA